MATIHDVARTAGVSIATVSACVNASAPVSDRLRRRVEEAIAQTGYRPDAMARGLKTGVTRMLGLAATSLSDPTTAAMAWGAAQAAAEKSYAMLLAGSGDTTGLEARRVEGIVALDGLPGSNPKCPAVTVGPPNEGIDSVSADHAQMADAAVEHLAGLGHTRIAMVIGQSHVPHGERALAGYRQALARHGIRFQPSLVRVAAQGKAGAGRQDQSRDIARALLAAQEWPSALVVCGGALALGMVGAMTAAGLACPAGMSVVTLGDGDWAAHASPPLTAIAEPAQEIGGEAVRLLLERLAGGANAPARRVLVPGAVIVRNSTAAPAARD